ncbi:hypothetical protein HPHPH3_1016 [Helicobacter pylori Hp H-3]|nr:hypothetical protein HPHPH3_1016 [Helicobacter pylori Hp H-3]
MKLNSNLIELETKENFYDKQKSPFLKSFSITEPKIPIA